MHLPPSTYAKYNNYILLNESSEGSSSITIPKSRGIPSSACLGTPSLYISKLQKTEPPRCQALRTRGGRLYTQSRETSNIYIPLVFDFELLLLVFEEDGETLLPCPFVVAAAGEGVWFD